MVVVYYFGVCVRAFYDKPSDRVYSFAELKIMNDRAGAVLWPRRQGFERSFQSTSGCLARLPLAHFHDSLCSCRRYVFLELWWVETVLWMGLPKVLMKRSPATCNSWTRTNKRHMIRPSWRGDWLFAFKKETQLDWVATWWIDPVAFSFCDYQKK